MTSPHDPSSASPDTITCVVADSHPVLCQARGAPKLPALSAREREILRLLADGKSNQEIAEQLSISPDTIRTYIRRAMDKLEAHTRTQAVAIAIRQALISRLLPTGAPCDGASRPCGCPTRTAAPSLAARFPETRRD